MEPNLWTDIHSRYYQPFWCSPPFLLWKRETCCSRANTQVASSLHRISATSADIRSTWRDIERHLELHASRSNIPRPRDIPSNGNIIYWKCGKQRLIFCHFTVAVFSFVLVEKMLCFFAGSLSPLFAPLESGLLQHYQHQASVRTFTQLLQPQAWIILS